MKISLNRDYWKWAKHGLINEKRVKVYFPQWNIEMTT